MMLDQGRIGLCRPGLSRHSSLPARVGYVGSGFGFEGHSICFVRLAILGEGAFVVIVRLPHSVSEDFKLSLQDGLHSFDSK